MAIEGPLKELGIHDVFQLLDLSRKTGVLRVVSDIRHNRGTVYFDRGAVVYAEVESSTHPIGSMLVQSGRVSALDIQRATELQKEGDKRLLGEILVDIGAISAQDLAEQVKQQIEEVTFDMMNWREGYFSFTEGLDDGVPLKTNVRIPTEALLMEGARRIDEWSRIERKITDLGLIPRLASVAEDSDPGMLNLLPVEWEVLVAIDNETDIRGIAKNLGKSEFDVAKIIFGLESAGVISLAPAKPETRVSKVDDVSHQVVTIHELLEEGDLLGARSRCEASIAIHPGEPELHLLMARIERQAGDPVRMEDCLRRVLRLDPLLKEAHKSLGDALAMQGKLGEAVEWWERWLTIEEHAANGKVPSRKIRDAIDAARTLKTFLEETG